MITSEIVNKSIDYIMNHLDEEITVEDVAKHCHFSKFYFSRIFKAETGESIYAFIKRLKMEQSAIRLKIERDKSITDIGYDYGYSPSNYSSVFKQHHRRSPAEFRKGLSKEFAVHPHNKDRKDHFLTFQEYQERITIQELPDFQVVYERFIGNYSDLERNWCDFTNKYQKYCTKDSLMIERSYDDPSITDVEQCLYDICMTVEPDCSLPNLTTIRGGRCAVFRFEGTIDEIFVAFQGIFNVWLPECPYEMDERYGLDIYRFVDMEKKYVVMDLCIPIQ